MKDRLRTGSPYPTAAASWRFLTGSAAEVTPVGVIGDYTFTPGEVCHTLAEDYTRLVRGHAAPKMQAAE